MENKVLVKKGHSKKHGYWTALTNQIDYYVEFQFGSSEMKSNTYYKITKEIFDEIDEDNEESANIIVTKGKKLKDDSYGKWVPEQSNTYISNWQEEYAKIRELNYCINLQRLLKTQNKEYIFSNEIELIEIYNEIYRLTTTYYASIMSFDEKEFYAFTYKGSDYACSYPIYKEEYEELINTPQTNESIEIWKKKCEKRFIYDNEYMYAEV